MKLISKGFFYKGDTQKIYRSEWEDINRSNGLVQFLFKYKYWYLSSSGLDYCKKEFLDESVKEIHVPSSMFAPAPKGQELNNKEFNDLQGSPSRLASKIELPDYNGVSKEALEKIDTLEKEQKAKNTLLEDSNIPLSEKLNILQSNRLQKDEQLCDFKPVESYMDDGEYEDVIYKSGISVDDWGRPSLWSSIEYVKDTSDLNVPEHFNTWLDKTLQRIKETLSVKGDEYSKERMFDAIEAGAKFNNISVPTYVEILQSKHQVNRKTWVKNLNEGVFPSQERIDEKYQDPIVYDLLVWAWITNQKRKS